MIPKKKRVELPLSCCGDNDNGRNSRNSSQCLSSRSLRLDVCSDNGDDGDGGGGGVCKGDVDSKPDTSESKSYGSGAAVQSQGRLRVIKARKAYALGHGERHLSDRAREVIHLAQRGSKYLKGQNETMTKRKVTTVATATIVNGLPQRVRNQRLPRRKRSRSSQPLPPKSDLVSPVQRKRPRKVRSYSATDGAGSDSGTDQHGNCNCNDDDKDDYKIANPKNAEAHTGIDALGGHSSAPATAPATPTPPEDCAVAQKKAQMEKRLCEAVGAERASLLDVRVFRRKSDKDKDTNTDNMVVIYVHKTNDKTLFSLPAALRYIGKIAGGGTDIRSDSANNDNSGTSSSSRSTSPIGSGDTSIDASSTQASIMPKCEVDQDEYNGDGEDNHAALDDDADVSSCSDDDSDDTCDKDKLLTAEEMDMFLKCIQLQSRNAAGRNATKTTEQATTTKTTLSPHPKAKDGTIGKRTRASAAIDSAGSTTDTDVSDEETTNKQSDQRPTQRSCIGPSRSIQTVPRRSSQKTKSTLVGKSLDLPIQKGGNRDRSMANENNDDSASDQDALSESDIGDDESTAIAGADPLEAPTMFHAMPLPPEVETEKEKGRDASGTRPSPIHNNVFDSSDDDADLFLHQSKNPQIWRRCNRSDAARDGAGKALETLDYENHLSARARSVLKKCLECDMESDVDNRAETNENQVDGCGVPEQSGQANKLDGVIEQCVKEGPTLSSRDEEDTGCVQDARDDDYYKSMEAALLAEVEASIHQCKPLQASRPEASHGDDNSQLLPNDCRNEKEVNLGQSDKSVIPSTNGETSSDIGRSKTPITRRPSTIERNNSTGIRQKHCERAATNSTAFPSVPISHCAIPRKSRPHLVETGTPTPPSPARCTSENQLSPSSVASANIGTMDHTCKSRKKNGRVGLVLPLHQGQELDVGNEARGKSKKTSRSTLKRSASTDTSKIANLSDSCEKMVGASRKLCAPTAFRVHKYSPRDEPAPSLAIVATRLAAPDLSDIAQDTFTKSSSKDVRSKRVRFYGHHDHADETVKSPRSFITCIDGKQCFGLDERTTLGAGIVSMLVESKREKLMSHSWIEKHLVGSYCKRCDVRKYKSIECENCRCCAVCGPKVQCPQGNNYSSRKEVTAVDQTQLLQRAYQKELATAFGLTLLSTTDLNLDDDRFDDDLVESGSSIGSAQIALGKMSKGETIQVPPCITRSAWALICHTHRLMNAGLDVSEIKGANKYAGQTILFAAVLFLDSKTVLTLLKCGVNPRHKDFAGFRAIDYARSARDSCKATLDKILEATPSSHEHQLEAQRLEMELIDLNSKYDMLQMFMDVYRLEAQVKNINFWIVVQVTWKNAIIDLNEGAANLCGMKNELFCLVTWDGRKEHPTDSVPMSSNPDWSQKRSRYCFRFNQRMPSTIHGKKIVFELYIGDPHGEKAKLGEVIETGERIYKNASEKEVCAAFYIDPGQCKLLKSGKASIALQKLPHDEEYKIQMAKKIGLELRDLLSRIESFGHKAGKNALSPIFGISVLRCALLLNDIEVVKRLLLIGIDPMQVDHLVTNSPDPLNPERKKILLLLKSHGDKKKQSAVPRRKETVVEASKTPPDGSHGLPTLEDANWMETSSKKRCIFFPGCIHKEKCKYGHVVFRVRCPNVCNVVPASDALYNAYRKNWGVHLRQSSCVEKVVTDDSGRKWYAAGLICPVEGVRYYGQGGVGGKENSQHVWLYPSREHAVAAVAVTVLDEFKRQGNLFCEWGEPRRLGVQESCHGSNHPSSPSSIDYCKRKTNSYSVKKAYRDPGNDAKGCLETSFSGEQKRVKRIVGVPFERPNSDDGDNRDEKNESCTVLSEKVCSSETVGHTGTNVGGVTGGRHKRKVSLDESAPLKRLCSTEPSSGDMISNFLLGGLVSNAEASLSPYQEKKSLFTMDNSDTPPSDQFKKIDESSKQGISTSCKSKATSCSPLPPRLSHADWMLKVEEKRCKYFVPPYEIGCCKKSKCHFAHVFDPTAANISIAEPLVHFNIAQAYRSWFGPDATLNTRDRFYLCKQSDGKTWHTSAVRCPIENIIYYSNGGACGEKSDQGIYWYPTGSDAERAVDNVILAWHRKRGFSLRQGMKDRSQWTISDSSFNAIFKGTRDNEGSIVSGFSEQVKHKQKATAVCQRDSSDEKSGNCRVSSNQIVNVTCVNGLIFQPPKFQGSPDIFKCTGGEQDCASVLPRKKTLNTLTPSIGYGPKKTNASKVIKSEAIVMLPCLVGYKHAKTWMLCLPKINLCNRFKASGVSGCWRGKECRYAHIFASTNQLVPSGVMPNANALKIAYKHNFGRHLLSDCIEVKKECSLDGVIWWTAAFRCPEEDIIYLSEGFSGFKSSQNLWWYKSEAEAFSAAQATVLNAFHGRKLYTPWTPQCFLPNMCPRGANVQNGCSFQTNTESCSNVKSNVSVMQLLDNATPKDDILCKVPIPPLPVETNLQALYQKLFDRVTLPRECFTIETSVARDGKTIYTAKFKSPAESNKVYTPQGNGGMKIGGKWWYEDIKIAKLATFSMLAKSLEERGVIKSAKKLLSCKIHGK